MCLNPKLTLTRSAFMIIVGHVQGGKNFESPDVRIFI